MSFSIFYKSKLLKTTFFVFSSAISITTYAIDLPANKLEQEFENKLSSQSILQSTKYYARGLTYQVNQKWDEAAAIETFSNKGYRRREPEQAILSGDFVSFSTQACSNTFSLSLLQDSTCFHWKNSSNQEAYVVVVYQNIIQQIFKLDPIHAVNTAQTDPVLVAQFRNNEPLMQIEHKIADYPVQCLNAVMAIEDNDFLEHSGVSISGLARAVIKNITSLRKAQGGSTITQQLVKNYFLTPEKTYTRKLKELYMAIKLESKWSKDEILQTYLNVIYMGQNGAFQVRGFGAASQYYFNKPVTKLNLSECALLAAIINNPGLNNPWKKTEKSQSRRSLVLTKMYELKLISEKELTDAKSASMPAPNKSIAAETAPYFFEAVRMQATEHGLPIVGTTFYTSLDLKQQDIAQKSLQEGIKSLTASKKSLAQKKEKGFELQGVVISAEQNTGLITTFVGGQSFKQSQFNRALYSKRQIGSLIKPFVYLTGLEYGIESEKNITPTTLLNDQAFEWKYDRNKSWKPENYDRKFRGEIPYFYALKESLNSPTAQIAHDVTLPKLIETCHALGLSSEIAELPSSSLGASQHTPLEVLQAYSNIARFGRTQNLSFIEKALDEEGHLLYEYKPEQIQKTDETKTAVLVGMMKESLNTGTAKAVRPLGFSKIAAGKTGTTSDGKDVWFAGFTPQVTSVVWLGFDQNISTVLTGGGAAVPIWTSFMQQITLNDSDIDFKWPETTETKEIQSDKDQKIISLIFEK